MAQRADDIKFELSTDAGTTYTDYTPSLIDLTPPSMDRTMIDVTPLTATHKVYLAGSVDAGEISATFLFDESDIKLWGTAGLMVEANKSADDAILFLIRISYPADGTETAVYTGYLSSSAVAQATKDEKATLTATFKLTGAATLS